MKILLVGGSGQLGSSLKSLSWSENTQLLSPQRNQLDICDNEQTRKYLEFTEPQVIINASAWTDVPGAESNYDSAVMINSTAVGALALGCKEVGATLFHISTDYVFDGEKSQSYVETDLTNPLNNYGKSKLSGEIEISASGLENFYILRTSWLYSQFGKNFVKTIAAKALRGESASIVDDQFGSPTYAGDLALGIQSAINVKPNSGIYHYANQGTVSWFEFGQEIYRLTGADVSLVTSRKSDPTELRRPKYSPLKTSKWMSSNLREIPDWRHSLQKELPRIIQAIRMEGM